MTNKSLFKLQNSEQVRNSLTKKQLRNIRKMYVKLYQDVLEKLKNKTQSSFTKQDLLVLKHIIEQRIKNINEQLEKEVIDNMFTMCETVVEDTKDYLVKCGFKQEDVQKAFVHVPEHVVNSIKTGSIYQKGWSLSKAIWGYNKGTQNKLNNIIARGLQQGKSAYDIAKDIEKYVQTGSRKSSKTIHTWRYDKNGNKIKDSFRFGNVDYNAQRLARTLISHAYQQSFQNTNKDDPFIIGYRWLTSNFHGRVCSICRERAETDQFGLGVGVFPKDQLPLDHPNGMCTFEAVFNKTPEEIGDIIDKWYEAPVGTYPAIDKYAATFLKD